MLTHRLLGDILTLTVVIMAFVTFKSIVAINQSIYSLINIARSSLLDEVCKGDTRLMFISEVNVSHDGLGYMWGLITRDEFLTRVLSTIRVNAVFKYGNAICYASGWSLFTIECVYIHILLLPNMTYRLGEIY